VPATIADNDQHESPPGAETRRQSRFAVWFVVLAGIGLSTYFFPYEEAGIHARPVFEWYLSLYAHVTGVVLHVFDGAVSVVGNTINGRFAMRIVQSCDAMEANILFCAAMLAFPAPWRLKAIALPIGLASLIACNIVRLCCLYYVGIYAPDRFDFAHYEAWPILMVGLATVDFLLCTRWMMRGSVRIGVGVAAAGGGDAKG
jgi:exosortase/archaeosortase family protein